MIRKIYPRLDDVLRSLTGGRLYAAYQLPVRDLVGTDLDEDPRPAIEQAGYTEVALLGAAKEHPYGGIYDIGSYRRVAEEHPPGVEGTALEEWGPGQCQYHSHVWRLPLLNTWDVACHYELRSSLFRPRPNVERLWTHYHPEWGDEKLLGEMDHRLREMLP